MPTVNTKTQRNQSMELAKMVTAVLFCFSHIDKVEEISTVAAKLSSFGLPMFFAISGYFAYGATSRKLLKRLLHIVRLYVIAYAFHLVVGCILVELDGGSTVAYLKAAVPDLDEIVLWSIVQHDSFLAHLWTMASTAICYIVLWMYTKFQGDKQINYTPLYIVSVILFGGYLTMDTVLPAAGIGIHYLAYRNAWFLGIPSFALGTFLHQYQERIFEAFSLSARKLAIATVVTYLLVTIGMRMLLPLEVVFLMLLVISVPRYPENSLVGKIADKCGIWSTGVYILHITMRTIYYEVIQDPMISLLGEKEPWFQPLSILVMAFVGALIWDSIDRNLKKTK